MHSTILSVAVVALADSFSFVRADTWFAVSTGDAGEIACLDSSNAKIEATIETSIAAVIANKDKGERFRFPTGSGGILISQAHENHAVGYDNGKNEFHADFAQNHFDALVKVTLGSDNGATFCNNDICIGPGGRPTTTPFVWHIIQINSA